MARLTLILALSLSLAAATAQALEKKPPELDVGQYVDLSPVGLPIVADGRLVNYVFVHARINLTSGANASKMRQKEPFFRDALVRAGHRTPFTIPSDHSKIDTVRLTAALQREAVAIAGPGAVKSVAVTSQASRKRIATPRT
ncbi:hypothetical protein [Phenylobacterium sp.]|uniref:hypothetical protein n=1 Tax=Phenylobacterium sp. TaxID=1871053 RepID=UPI003983030E